MKKIIIIILLLITYSKKSDAQQSKKLYVEYDVSEGVFNYKAKLVATNGEAVYYHDKSKQAINNELDEDAEGNYIVATNNNERSQMRYYINQYSPEVYFTESYKDEKYLVKDKVPVIDWKISANENKKIQNFDCTKATATFRGSEIVAYFSTEIPIPFGPWKFKGLPGLILEAYVGNAIENYRFSVTKIVFPFKENISLKLTEKEKEFTEVTYQNFTNKKTNEFLNKLKIASARLPFKTTLKKTKITRTAIEKIFEWE